MNNIAVTGQKLPTGYITEHTCGNVTCRPSEGSESLKLIFAQIFRDIETNAQVQKRFGQLGTFGRRVGLSQQLCRHGWQVRDIADRQMSTSLKCIILRGRNRGLYEPCSSLLSVRIFGTIRAIISQSWLPLSDSGSHTKRI